MREWCRWHRRPVGVPMEEACRGTGWATASRAGGLGGGLRGGCGSGRDGVNPFVTTGNTSGTGSNWSGGEAVIRFQPGPIFSGSPTDYWAPTNWLSLDQSDSDLGGSGPLLVDVPDATPSRLVVAMGKDRKAYLVNRDNLGGISQPVASAQVASNTILQAAVTYRTKQGTYVAFRANNDGDTVLSAFRITATNPPAIDMASGWSVTRASGGCGSPFVTSNNGTNNMIVWVVGTEDHQTGGDQRLHGYDGDTGAIVYDGGGPNELMAGTHYYSTTGIAARGRIYVAGDNKVYAFEVPTSSPTPTATPTATATPTPTATPTSTPTPTVTPTPTPRSTPTPRPHPAPQPRPTPR